MCIVFMFTHLYPTYKQMERVLWTPLLGTDQVLSAKCQVCQSTPAKKGNWLAVEAIGVQRGREAGSRSAPDGVRIAQRPKGQRPKRVPF